MLKLAKKRIYIDTFAGCGGLSLGLKLIGWRGSFAVEKDPMAFETFFNNLIDPRGPYAHFTDWPKWLPQKEMSIEDILDDPFLRKNLEKLNGKISLIAGGPPCQGFSVGGCRNGRDPRNTLVYKHIDLVRIIAPPLVLIENVEGIVKSFKSKPSSLDYSVADEVLDRLSEIGYSTGLVTVNATDFGVPQTRKRVLLIGITKELADGIDIKKLFLDLCADACIEQRQQFDLPTDRPVNIKEALHDLAGDNLVQCPDSPKFESSTYLNTKSEYAKLMRKGIRTGEIPNSHRFSKHTEKVLALYRKAHDTQPRGRLSRDFLLENGTKTRKKVLLDPDAPSTTITTHPDEQIHYKYPRNVSLREMARLQSFPDDFWFYGRYTLNGDRRGLDVSRCAQIGNAIPPLLARGIGLTLNKILQIISVENQKRMYLSRNDTKKCAQMSLFE